MQPCNIMAHVCDESEPERCINPDGSYCRQWEARIGNRKRTKSVRDIPTDPAAVLRLAAMYDSWAERLRAS